jgi:hypothetical protein
MLMTGRCCKEMQFIWKLSQRECHRNVDEPHVNINSWRSVIDHYLMIQYRGKMETTTFCHQIPKLVQDKTEICQWLCQTIHYGNAIICGLQLLRSAQLRTWLCLPQTELKPEKMNAKWWSTLLLKDAFSWEWANPSRLRLFSHAQWGHLGGH